MKNQWPFWLFIIAILIVVVIAMNYQGKQDVAPFGDIFSHEQGALEYEYVTQPDQKVAASSPDPKAVAAKGVLEPPKAEAGISKLETKTISAPATVPTPAAVPSPQDSVKDAAQGSGSFAVQILSSKDQKATEAELQKVKNNGFPDAYTSRVDLGDRGIWYRIYVGRYPSMDQAQEGLIKVKQKYPQAFIFKF